MCVRSCRSPLFPSKDAPLNCAATSFERGDFFRMRRKRSCYAYKVGGRAALAEDDLRPLPCLELPALPTLHHNVVGVDCNTAVIDNMSSTAPLERSSKRSRLPGVGEMVQLKESGEKRWAPQVEPRLALPQTFPWPWLCVTTW